MQFSINGPAGNHTTVIHTYRHTYTHTVYGGLSRTAQDRSNISRSIIIAIKLSKKNSFTTMA